MNVDEIFNEFFEEYKAISGKSDLHYVKTSGYRSGGKNNPHAIEGNAIDFTLRILKSYAPLREYKELFKYMIEFWEYRAGADLTETETKKGVHPNVHIHVDLGQNRPEDQEIPFFFIEDNFVYKETVTDYSQIV